MLEYNVKATGIEDIERLTKAVDGLEGVLTSARGSGKSLEEVRKIIVGLKGQGSVFQELAKSIASIDPAIDKLANSFKGFGNQITATLKSEMQHLRGTLQTELRTLATGIGSPLEKQIAKEIGGAIVSGTEEGAAKAKSAAAKVRAEMTAAYEQLVGGNGLKDLGKLELAEVERLKAAGASISKYHSKIIADTKSYITTTENLAQEAAALRLKSAPKRHSEDEVRLLLGLPKRSDMARVAMQHKADLISLQKEIEATARAQVSAATNAPAGTYQAYNPRTGAAGTIKNAEIDAASKALDAQRRADEAFTQAQLANAERVRAKEEKDRNARLAHIKYVFDMQQNSHKAELGRIAAEAAAAKRAFEDRVRQSVIAATNNPVGAYQAYTASTGMKGTLRNQEVIPKETAPALKGAKLSAIELDDAFRKLGFSGNNVHSMARGLASGFNLLWLTWGNLAPLFAGAAISNGFMQTAKQGMEVANTLAIIERLGENTAGEMKLLTAEMIDLGYNGPRGPKEIAEAFKVLSLAGLKANDVLAVTKTVMNFSTAGATDLQTAADVLVSVTTAFGTGAAGFERSADIIARAAADSKASVESFGEAMKTASVVGELYGATQEDVAVGIQYLAQLGIQSTAAGTALRNMFADISGRSGQSIKLLKSLGLEFKDLATGKIIPVIEQMRQLDTVLRQYDKPSQTSILTALFGERGQKAAIGYLQAFNTAAKDSSKYANKLEEDLARAGDAAGESAVNAAYLGQTTEKMFAQAGATFRTTMFQAFQDMEPQLYLMADAFRKAFASPEAAEGLKFLTGTVADLGVALAENLKPLAQLAIGWGAVRLAAAAVTGVLTLSSGLLRQYVQVKVSATAATVAATAAERRYAAAVTAAGVAGAAAGAAQLGMFARLAGAIPIVGNLISLAAGAWLVYDTYATKAGNSADEYASTKADNIIAALEKETERLHQVNAARREGLTLAEAEARVKSANTQADITADYEPQVLKQQKLVDDLRKQAERLRSPVDASAGKLQLLEANAAEKELNKLLAEREQRLSRLTAAEEARRAVAKESERITADEIAKAREGKGIPAGGLSFDLADWQDEMRKAGRGPSAASQYYDEEFELFKKQIDAQKEIVSTLYEQGKISASDYYDWLDFRAAESYAKEREALKEKAEALALDPKSVKDHKKALTDIAAMDMRFTAETMKLGQQRSEANDKADTPLQQIQAEGKSRLDRASAEDVSGLSIKFGGRELERQTAIAQIEQSYFDMRLQAQKRFNKAIEGQSEEGIAKKKEQLALELAEIKKFSDEEIRLNREKEAKKEVDRSKYSNGVKRAYQDYIASATDYAAQAANATASLMKSAEDSFVNFVKTGEIGWRTFANAAIDQLARIASQQFTGALGSVLGSVGSSLLTIFNAQGGVYDSPSLSKYSNQVHSSPKVFAFAKGAGVFGEAGPEAIMPLTRGPDGNLGVRNFGSGGGGSSSGVQLTINTNVYADGTSNTTVSSTDASQTKVLGEALNLKVKTVIAGEAKQGGLIWRLVNGR